MGGLDLILMGGLDLKFNNIIFEPSIQLLKFRI